MVKIFYILFFIISLNSFTIASGWEQENDNWYYYDVNENKVLDGWVEGYYLNHSGIMAKGIGNGYGTTVTLNTRDMNTNLTECLQGMRVSMNLFKENRNKEKYIYHIISPLGIDTSGEDEWDNSEKEKVKTLEWILNDIGTWHYFITDVSGNVLIDNTFKIVPAANYQPYENQEVYSEHQVIHNLADEMNSRLMIITSTMAFGKNSKRKDDEWKEFMIEVGHDEADLKGEYEFDD